MLRLLQEVPREGTRRFYSGVKALEQSIPKGEHLESYLRLDCSENTEILGWMLDYPYYAELALLNTHFLSMHFLIKKLQLFCIRYQLVTRTDNRLKFSSVLKFLIIHRILRIHIPRYPGTAEDFGKKISKLLEIYIRIINQMQFQI